MRRLLLHLIFGKEVDEVMAMLWAQKIVLGKKKYSDVPRLLKEQVEEILIESGMRAYLRRDSHG